MPDADASTTDNAPAQVVETTAPAPTATTEPAKPEPKVFDEGYVKALRSEAAKYRNDAKAAADELEKLRAAAMSEQERAILQARQEGRLAAIAEIGSQLVDARIEAAAKGRLTDGQIAVLLQGLNRSRFLKDDGTVNDESVKAWVDGIAPPPAAPQETRPMFPDLGQGARGDAQALNGDPLLRDLKAKLGIA